MEQAREDDEGRQEAFAARVACDLVPCDLTLALRFDLEKFDVDVGDADDVIVKLPRRQSLADEIVQGVLLFEQIDAAPRERLDLLLDARAVGAFVLAPQGQLDAQHFDGAAAHADTRIAVDLAHLRVNLAHILLQEGDDLLLFVLHHGDVDEQLCHEVAIRLAYDGELA